jgi:hypothetical protein
MTPSQNTELLNLQQQIVEINRRNLELLKRLPVEYQSQYAERIKQQIGKAQEVIGSTSVPPVNDSKNLKS